jgi:hypothetical protein
MYGPAVVVFSHGGQIGSLSLSLGLFPRRYLDPQTRHVYRREGRGGDGSFMLFFGWVPCHMTKQARA